jgi:hypothetical protein
VNHKTKPAIFQGPTVFIRRVGANETPGVDAGSAQSTSGTFDRRLYDALSWQELDRFFQQTDDQGTDEVPSWRDDADSKPPAAVPAHRPVHTRKRPGRPTDTLPLSATTLTSRLRALEDLANRYRGRSVIVLTASGRVKGTLVEWRDNCIVLERNDSRVALPAACIRSLSTLR